MNYELLVKTRTGVEVLQCLSAKELLRTYILFTAAGIRSIGVRDGYRLDLVQYMPDDY